MQGQLGAGGQFRSGNALTAAAAIPTDLGLQLENLLTQRSAGLSGGGQQAALGLGGLGAQAGQGSS